MKRPSKGPPHTHRNSSHNCHECQWKLKHKIPNFVDVVRMCSPMKFPRRCQWLRNARIYTEREREREIGKRDREGDQERGRNVSDRLGDKTGDKIKVKLTSRTWCGRLWLEQTVHCAMSSRSTSGRVTDIERSALSMHSFHYCCFRGILLDMRGALKAQHPSIACDEKYNSRRVADCLFKTAPYVYPRLS